MALEFIGCKNCSDCCLHDLHQKITGPEAKNDASFKSGTTLIQDGYAYFKFDTFYKKLKNIFV